MCTKNTSAGRKETESKGMEREKVREVRKKIVIKKRRKKRKGEKDERNQKKRRIEKRRKTQIPWKWDSR